MVSLKLLTENKIASVGAAAIVTGVVLMFSALAVVDPIPVDGETESANAKKRKTLYALGGSLMSIGVMAQVYDQFTRRSSSRGAGSSYSLYGSSSEMSPAELSRFQDRVSAAAANLRKSIAQSGAKSSSSTSSSSNTLPSTESAAELAARASAQISSFIERQPPPLRVFSHGANFYASDEAWYSEHEEELLDIWHRLEDSVRKRGLVMLDKCRFNDFCSFVLSMTTTCKKDCI